MQRSSIIATVVAAGGILIAGSVASVAVINAASSSEPDSETIQLVAAGSTATPSPEATVSISAEQAAPVAELPTMEASKLPEIPEVTQSNAQPAVQDAPATAGTSVRKPSASKGSDDDSAPTRAAEPAATVSADQARSIVLKQGDGVSIVSTSKESHQGYSTWAIRITRSNGEVLTGYVDRASGVVVDWTVNQKAPATTPSPSATSDDDSASDDSSDDDSSSGSEDDHSGSGSDDSSDDDHDEDDD